MSQNSHFLFLKYLDISQKGGGYFTTEGNTVGKIPQNCVIINFTNSFGFCSILVPEINFYLNLWTKITLQIFSFSRILFPTVQ